jgi:hypothetical protein
MTMALAGVALPAGFPDVTPDPGQQFVSPGLISTCLLPPDSSCRIGSFELIDSRGTRHSPAIAVSGAGFLPLGEFPGGSSIEGSLVFMVPVGTGPFLLRNVGPEGREAYFLLE